VSDAYSAAVIRSVVLFCSTAQRKGKVFCQLEIIVVKLQVDRVVND